MELLFHEQFSNNALNTPDFPALSDSFGTLSYKEANELSNGIAMMLCNAGLRQSEAVAVLVPKKKEIMLGAIGIIKAGGVYLPLDEVYPNERLLYMMENADVRFILADRTLWEQRALSKEDRVVFFFDDIKEIKTFVSPILTSEDPAMILYTSGTTGKPKGVIHRHALLQGVNDYLLNNKEINLNSKSHMGIISGFTFVATNVFMFGVLLAAGRLFIAPASAKLGTDTLYSFIKENKITHIFLPSSLATTMAEEYDMSGTAIFAGGEKLRNFKPYSDGTCVYNMYGCTESATIFTNRVYGNEPVMPIGYLTQGAEALIVNDKLEKVKDNESGELLLNYKRMSKSYLKLPELTAEKWIWINNKLYFRTGDLMRHDEDGRYYILGRIDNMVKLRGFRIETGEVENQVSRAFVDLKMHVGQVAVVLKNVNGIDHLACYYESENSCDTEAITRKISEFLPSYMIPDLWTRVESMPRNANGKLIRSELPEPELPIHLIGIIESEAELRVIESVGYLLKLQGAIDPEESFTQLGGDSLRAMELSANLKEQGISISSNKILSLPSLREIAKNARIKYERLWSVEEYETVKKAYREQGEEIEEVGPLSPVQDDMLCSILTHPDRPIPFRRYMFEVLSRLSEDKLRSVLDKLGKMHPELRASVAYHGVSVFQSVITNRSIPLKFISSIGTNLSFVRELVAYEDKSINIDLQFTPLFRITCVDRGQEGSWLFVAANKFAYSISNLRVILTDMMELLLEHYPLDTEIKTWAEIFKEATAAEKNTASSIAQSDESKNEYSVNSNFNIPPELCIYSDKPSKKIFFVHTGNTGSAAYYSLAERIKKDFAFAVFEPYNMYHPDSICHGIEEVAAKYIEILKKHQPNGPYILGGWCYGGVIAHEMACQLEASGDKIEHLFMFDSHTLANPEFRRLAAPMQASLKRSYFETSPLFKELRENGMLEAIIANSVRVAWELNNHVPKHFHGYVTYFKPEHTPEAASGEVLKYWQEMMKLKAGNYENYCDKDKLEVIMTPKEHDEMMTAEALDVIVPKLYEVLESI